MNSVLFALAIFLGGIIEVFSLTQPESWPKIAKNVLWAILGSTAVTLFFLLKEQAIFKGDFSTLISWVMIAVTLLAALSIKYVLPRIDEMKVALLHILFILTLLSYGLEIVFQLKPVVILGFIIITAIIFTNLFLTEKPVHYFRLGLYIWYLFLVFILATLRATAFFHLFVMPDLETQNAITFANHVIDGGIYMYFSLHLVALFNLVPGKRSTSVEVRKHIKLLISKFSVRQANIKKFLLISGIMIAAFIINHFVQFIPQLTLTGFLFLLIPIVPERVIKT